MTNALYMRIFTKTHGGKMCAPSLSLARVDPTTSMASNSISGFSENVDLCLVRVLTGQQYGFVCF